MLQPLLARISLRYPWIATPFLLCGGCNLFADTSSPMPLEIHGNPQTAERVVILLPGIRDRGDKFIESGFVDDAREWIDNQKLALIVADAHVGYYRERNITERLVADILGRWPDRKFIFAGVSLGGFGSLTVARLEPGRIESILLLAPFLGERPFMERLSAGAPRPMPDDDLMEAELTAIWQFLISTNRPDIFLAYGQDDSFSPFYRRLKELQPAIQMHITDGGHDWPTWRRHWNHWLQVQS